MFSRKLKPQLFTQAESNDLVRDSGLTKNKAELIGSRFKEKHLLESRIFIQGKDLVYCHNIYGLVSEFGIEHKKEDYRLFIDSSKTSFKVVLLLHNGNMYLCLGKFVN